MTLARRLLRALLVEARDGVFGIVGIVGTLVLLERVGPDLRIALPALVAYASLYLAALWGSERLTRAGLALRARRDEAPREPES
jgi:hypothetical protein